MSASFVRAFQQQYSITHEHTNVTERMASLVTIENVTVIQIILDATFRSAWSLNSLMCAVYKSNQIVIWTSHALQIVGDCREECNPRLQSEHKMRPSIIDVIQHEIDNDRTLGIRHVSEVDSHVVDEIAVGRNLGYQ